MKKIIAIIAVFATLFSLSACKTNKTLEERQAELSEKQAKAAQESIKAEEQYQKGMSKYVDKLGTTEEGKRLVVKEPGTVDPEYSIYEFDKDEVLKKRYRYVFFSTVEMYEKTLESGDGIMRKLVDHDDKSRMLKYEIEFEEDPQLTFDFFYKNATDAAAVEAGFEVI